MTYVFSEQNLADLEVFVQAEDWAGFYQKIYDITAAPDQSGADADPHVREWFRVAQQANSGVGAASELIRSYTRMQVEIRTGGAVTDAQLSDASDEIARNVWQNQVSGEAAGRLPTLLEIYGHDAGAVVDVLNEENFDVGIEVWSGNLLFVGLGEDKPLHDNLLEIPADSYDLFVALHVSLTLTDDLLRAFVSSVYNGPALSFPLSTVLDAYASINDFVENAYGDHDAVRLLLSAEYVFDMVDHSTLGDAIAPEAVSSQIIHAGALDDEILGSDRRDLIDGGTGEDHVTFAGVAAYAGGALVRLSTVESLVPYSGYLTTRSGAGTHQTYLYDVERLTLGEGDDWVWFDSFTHLQEIDAAGQGEEGDTFSAIGFDASAAGATLIIDLEAEEVSYDGDTLTIRGFESAIGSDGDDVLRGGAGDDALDGGAGHDDVTGGEGDDVIQGGSGADLLEGGLGSDVLEGGAGSDRFVYAGGDDVMRGGAGANYYDVSGASAFEEGTVTIEFSADGGHDYVSSTLLISDVDLMIDFLDATIDEIQIYWDMQVYYNYGPGYNVASIIGDMTFEDMNTGASLTVESVLGEYFKSAYSGDVYFFSNFGIRFADGAAEFGDGFWSLNHYLTNSEDSRYGAFDDQSNFFLGQITQSRHAHADDAQTAFDEEREIADEGVMGTDGDDDLQGDGGADTIEGGEGDDLLAGGDGGDLYVFAAGDGADTIVETGGDNLISFGEGITLSAVQTMRVGADLRIDYGAGDSIVIEDRYASAAPEAEVVSEFGEVVFEDGARYGLGELEALQKGAVGEAFRMSLTEQWSDIDFNHTYRDPVVFALGATPAGTEVLATRLYDIGPDGAKIRLQETKKILGAFNPDPATAGEVTILVLEKGVHMLDDGTLLQVGAVNSALLLGDGYESVAFDQSFGAAAPQIFSQVQTHNGSDWVTTRHGARSADGFDLVMQEEEADNGAHAAEDIGWFAIANRAGSAGNWHGMEWQAGTTGAVVNGNETAVSFYGDFDAAPLVGASVTSIYGADAVAAQIETVGTDGFSLRAAEDRSHDAETAHGHETVDWIALSGAGSIYGGADAAIGETGTMSLGASGVHVVFDRSYDDPVVIATINGGHGAEPVAVRITDVDADGFDAALSYASLTPPAAPGAVSVAWIVVEAGSWELSDGTRLSAGVAETAATTFGGFDAVAFDAGFEEGPAVVAQTQTAAGADFVSVRVKDADADGFDFAMESQESLSGTSRPQESVGWIAMERGASGYLGGDGTWIEAGTTAANQNATATATADTLDFGGAVAGLSSFAGSDAAHAQVSGLGPDGFSVTTREDQTVDAELTHAAESIDWIAFDSDLTLFGESLL